METSLLSPTLSSVSVDDILISVVEPVPTSNTRLSPSNVVVNSRSVVSWPAISWIK